MPDFVTCVGLITVLILYRNGPLQSRLSAKEPTRAKVLSRYFKTL